MSKYLALVFILATIGMMAAYQNCGTKHANNDPMATTDSSSSITISGTVEQSDLDGCKLLIKADTGEYYIPVRSNTALLKPGATVKVTGLLRDDIVTTCMKGNVIQVDEAQVVNDPSATPTP